MKREAQKHNNVTVHHDKMHSLIVRYSVLTFKFLTLEEKNVIDKLTESEFLKMVAENNWIAYRQN